MICIALIAMLLASPALAQSFDRPREDWRRDWQLQQDLLAQQHQQFNKLQADIERQRIEQDRQRQRLDWDLWKRQGHK
jgi:hypothetical protein